MNFLQELQQLRSKIPHPTILNINHQNSEYCPYGKNNKNCYFLVGYGFSEDSYYGWRIYKCRDCVDNYNVFESELCYDCLDCYRCYDCTFLQDCENCDHCLHCYYCFGCRDCIGCVNLKRKQFHIFNQPYSKKEYLRKSTEIKTLIQSGQTQKILSQFNQLQLKSPRIYSIQQNTEACFGNHIKNGQRNFWCFDSEEEQDCLYLDSSIQDKDCVDCSYPGWSELCYECMSAVWSQNLNFCTFCWHSSNLEYCEYVFNSHDCFGCVSLNHAKYHILNHPYPKDEYFRRVNQIKAEMHAQKIYGQHLPSVYNDYNVTVASFHFPT